jgi:hypothetical protein
MIFDFFNMIVGIICIVSVLNGWKLIYQNTILMSTDYTVSKFYNTNLIVCVAIGLGVAINILFLIFPQENILYSLVPIVITLYGYISLWINTANMVADENANKYYTANEYASIYIGVPYALAMAYGIYSFNMIDFSNL